MLMMMQRETASLKTQKRFNSLDDFIGGYCSAVYLIHAIIKLIFILILSSTNSCP